MMIHVNNLQFCSSDMMRYTDNLTATWDYLWEMVAMSTLRIKVFGGKVLDEDSSPKK